MSPIAVLTLALWPLGVLSLFLITTPTRAVIIAFLAGWIFLPLSTLNVPGLPPFGKTTATSISLLPCILFFDLNRVFRYRGSLLDLPVLAWALAPIPSALANELPLWDGISSMSSNVLNYGVPYFCGRLYLNRQEAWLFCNQAIVFAAGCYIPLCLWEMRMGPTLHTIIYGFSGRANYEQRTFFGPFAWQPNVFMNSAFEVTMLMACAGLVAFWAWRTKCFKMPFGVDARLALITFVAITVLCKKWSGIGLMCYGFVVLLLIERTRTILWAAVLIGPAILYMVLFSLNLYRAEGVADLIRPISERRAGSLEFRLKNDSLLVDKAMERPLFGWSGWGRNRVYSEDGKDVTITDSAYGIYLGMFGLVGLTAVSSIFVIPISVYAMRWRVDPWPALRMAAPFVVVIGLHICDGLVNSFPNVMYPLFAGGIVGFCESARTRARLSEATGRMSFRTSGGRLSQSIS